jgi:tetratricopeptide (TPR) repeat protein
LLDEQFFQDEQFRPYLTDNFLTIHAFREDDLAHEEVPRDALFDMYSVSATPTVLVALSDGTEIDRIVGYDPPAEEFKTILENSYRGENTLLALKNAHKNDPEDIEVLAALTRKYQEGYQRQKAAESGRMILQQSDKARQVKVPYGQDNTAISAYEYARFTTIYEGPAGVEEFLKEFPESSLRKPAVSRLARYLYFPDYTEEAQRVYSTLLSRYPADPLVVVPYVRYCARRETNVDRGIALAEEMYKSRPDLKDDRLAQSFADLLLLKGEDGRAVKAYGQEYAREYVKEGDADALNGYAWFWAQQGKNLESALAAVKTSIDLENTANTWDTLSMVYWKMGEHEKAIEAEETALTMVGGQHEEFEKRIEEIREDVKNR